MLKLILLLIYIFLILTVIFLERKSPTEALLWVLVLVCLPYLGAILYLIFGSTIAIKLTAFIRKKRLQQYQAEKDPPSSTDSPFHGESTGLSDAGWLSLSDEDCQVVRFNASYNESPLTSYENASIYTSGKSHYEQLFQDIRHAETCIFVEFYTIHHDAVGEAFAAALAERARAGVEVLVLCDFIANLSTPQKMFLPLTQAGGKVIRVKPYFTHYRSHRKIVSIDHRISYIGGMNIGKQYANMAAVKNPWRDTQIRLEGEACARVLDEYFLTDWLCSVRQKDRSKAMARLFALPKAEPLFVSASAFSPRCTEPSSRNLCQFIVGGVDSNKEAVKMCYLSMIRSARKRIRIQSPYFIPDSSILDALKTAAAAGVEIELMIPGIKASFFLDPVTTYYCGQLLEYGARVYKYHGYIHAKTMIIDEELCCIGSVNMDIRSLQVDDEICGVFYENALVKQYTDCFDTDITNCTPYTWQTFLERDSRERFQESIFLLFAPLM